MDIMLYHAPQDTLDEILENIYDTELRFLASELFSYGFHDAPELESAINKALRVCRSAGISVRKNFKPVYTYKDEVMVCDWYLSDLGRKLVLLNGDPNNPFVAQFQVKLISRG
jgi:DNA-damage-inducible protein D